MVTVVTFLLWLMKLSCLAAAVPRLILLMLTLRLVVTRVCTLVVRRLIPGVLVSMARLMPIMWKLDLLITCCILCSRTWSLVLP